MFIQLYDDNDTYGILEITPDISAAEIDRLVSQYKKTDEEEFNADGLVEYLKKDGFIVKAIEPIRVFF